MITQDTVAFRTKRNSYIDFIKFPFSLVIMLFHLDLFYHGGRIMVDGFFMISGYFMMKKCVREDAEQKVGVSTIRFLWHKFMGLCPYVISSAAIGFVVLSIARSFDMATVLQRFLGLFYEVFHLLIAGFEGTYVVGISWYLSAMFFALAILYPFCIKYRENFVLTVCPVLCLLVYGFFSKYYRNIAITTERIDFASMGLLRGLAGCAAGCLLYECTTRLSKLKITKAGLGILTVLEVLGWLAVTFFMNKHPKSQYDFLCVFLLFALLTIGISSISYSGRLLNKCDLKFFGTASMLIAMNHYCWTELFDKVFGAEYMHSLKVLLYFLCVAASCAVSWLVGRLADRFFGWSKKIMWHNPA